MCYQKAAITFRDIQLCDLVRRRLAVFSSSWGYSKSNCRKLVSEGIAQDREAIDRIVITSYSIHYTKLYDAPLAALAW